MAVFRQADGTYYDNSTGKYYSTDPRQAGATEASAPTGNSTARTPGQSAGRMGDQRTYDIMNAFNAAYGHDTSYGSGNDYFYSDVSPSPYKNSTIDHLSPFNPDNAGVHFDSAGRREGMAGYSPNTDLDRMALVNGSHGGGGSGGSGGGASGGSGWPFGGVGGAQAGQDQIDWSKIFTPFFDQLGGLFGDWQDQQSSMMQNWMDQQSGWMDQQSDIFSDLVGAFGRQSSAANQNDKNPWNDGYGAPANPWNQSPVYSPNGQGGFGPTNAWGRAWQDANPFMIGSF